MVRSVPLIGAETVMASAMSLLGVVAHAMPVPSWRAPDISSTRRLAAGSCACRWLVFGDEHGNKMTFTLRVSQRRGAPNAPGARFLSPAAPEGGELATYTEARDQRAVPLDIICPDVV